MPPLPTAPSTQPLRVVAESPCAVPPESAASWPDVQPGLFDRLFEAWAERMQRRWQAQGWHGLDDLPRY